MIEHNQASGRSGLNFNGVTYDLDTTPGSVVVGGSLLLGGANHAVAATYLLDASAPVFVLADGSLTNDRTAADLVAHVAWWDGADLHVIKHT